MGEEIEVLEHHAHLLADRVDVVVVHLHSLKFDAAAGGDLQPVQAAQEGGLPCLLYTSQADQTNLNQIGADLVADGVDVIVAVATPTAATMLAAVEDTDIPVVYSAVTDPAAAGFDTEPNIVFGLVRNIRVFLVFRS